MINTIKRLLLAGCKTAFKTPIEVDSYNTVIRGWNAFRQDGSLSDVENRYVVNGIFQFHKSNLDHVILYYSRNRTDCLLLCKIGGRYKNIRISSYGLENREKNIVAVYF